MRLVSKLWRLVDVVFWKILGAPLLGLLFLDWFNDKLYGPEYMRGIWRTEGPGWTAVVRSDKVRRQ